MNFSKNLSILRRRAGYTQEGLAEALDVSRQAVSKWESGLTLPEAATLLTLAEVLHCTLDQLMREELMDDAEEAQRSEREAEEEEEEERYALFLEYNRHMDRYSLMISLGVALILTGVALMMALNGIGIMDGFSLVPLMFLIAVAVFLFIIGGSAHENFQKDHPVMPEFYTAEAVKQYRGKAQLGIAASVAAILLDVALFFVFGSLFDNMERPMILSIGLFMLILAGAVGCLIYFGMREEKYDIAKYNKEAAKQR